MTKVDKYNKLFMDIAQRSAEMSFCKRAKVGAVIVKDNRVLVNSWNGTPTGVENRCEDEEVVMLSKCCKASIYDMDSELYCSECKKQIGYVDQSGDLYRWLGDFNIEYISKTDHNRVIHAEANAILFAAKNGIATDDCELYVTLSPCSECAKMIAQAGIKKVYYKEKYRNTKGLDFLKGLGIEVRQV